MAPKNFSRLTASFLLLAPETLLGLSGPG